MCHVRMLLKRNTFTAANSKKRRKIACATLKALHIFFCILLLPLSCFASTISLHVTLIFFAPGSKKNCQAQDPVCFCFTQWKDSSEFLKDDWITCNVLELWTLLAFPLVPDSAVAHRSFRCWDRTEAVAKPTPTMICYDRHQQIPICRPLRSPDPLVASCWRKCRSKYNSRK